MHCPKCQEKMIPVYYGKPNKKMIEKAMKWEIILGGFSFKGSKPTAVCRACNYKRYKNYQVKNEAGLSNRNAAYVAKSIHHEHKNVVTQYCSLRLTVQNEGAG